MIGPIELFFAFFLDLAIGDPRWLPHPVRIVGRAVQAAERSLRAKCSTPSEEKWAGVFLVILIVVPTFFVTLAVYSGIVWFSRNALVLIGMVFLVFLTATTLSLRELIGSARLVIEALKDGSLSSARVKVGRIVGRDTGDLSETGVLKAAIESLAESLSDGVIAPLFYLAIGGLPAAMTYKAISTMDSMVGYKNERYLHFGWAAARLDDIANYIPARITGLLIAAAVFVLAPFRTSCDSLEAARRSISIMRRDGRKHPSPNSGIPEAAMAGGLGIMLGGPSTYGGVVVEKPSIGTQLTEDYMTAAETAVSIVKIASVLGVTVAMVVLALRAWL
jgi:adenosylcobinamide-phosphate synthase